MISRTPSAAARSASRAAARRSSRAAASSASTPCSSRATPVSAWPTSSCSSRPIRARSASWAAIARRALVVALGDQPGEHRVVRAAERRDLGDALARPVRRCRAQEVHRRHLGRQRAQRRQGAAHQQDVGGQRRRGADGQQRGLGGRDARADRRGGEREDQRAHEDDEGVAGDHALQQRHASMVACAAAHRDGERSPWRRHRRAGSIDAMTENRTETTTTTTGAPDAEDAAAARREERQGWLMLTAVFVGGGILVAVAALAT